jgi:hypothetical protein
MEFKVDGGQFIVSGEGRAVSIQHSAFSQQRFYLALNNQDGHSGATKSKPTTPL